MPSFDSDSPVYQEENMPFPILGAIALGTQFLGSIFGGLSAAKKERDALKREQTRKPFQLTSGTSAAMRTGYSPGGPGKAGTGQNIYSLMPMMNPRMMAMLGSRYSQSVYHPEQIAQAYNQAGAKPRGGGGKDAVYRELAEMRMEPQGQQPR